MMFDWFVIILGSLSFFLLFGRIKKIPCTTRDVPIQKISVIIPARNEEKNIAHLLSSLLYNEAFIHEIIVVDDQSLDDTYYVASSFGVNVVRLEHKPQDWIGKSYACYQGALKATGDLYLFIDADVVLNDDAINSLMDQYNQYNGVISIHPNHRIFDLYEEFSMFFNVIGLVGVNSLGLLQTNFSKGIFGQLFMISSKDYWKVDGHASIKNEVVDDLNIGRVFSKNKYPIHNFIGGNLCYMRMYPTGFRTLVEGWSKNIVTGSLIIPWYNKLFSFIWITLLIDGFLFVVNDILSLQFTFYSVLYVWNVLQLYIIARKVGNFSILSILFYPIYLFFFIGLFIYSLFKVLIIRRVTWKGRVIKT